MVCYRLGKKSRLWFLSPVESVLQHCLEEVCDRTDPHLLQSFVLWLKLDPYIPHRYPGEHIF